MASWLKRLLGPAKQPDMTITVTPNCVIRPGDTVLLTLPSITGRLLNNLKAAAEKALPGMRVVLVFGDGASSLNLTRALQVVLDQHGGDRRDDGGDNRKSQSVKPLTEATDAAKELWDRTFERKQLSGLAVLADNQIIPVAAPEPLDGSHGGNGSASMPMPQHPIRQPPANPAESKNTPCNPNDYRDVRRGIPD